MENRYELLYIVPTSFTDEEAGAIESKISALITKYGATVQNTTRLGKLRMAYPIDEQRHGHYIMTMFTAEGSALATIEDNLRINNDILRHLILRADEAGSDQKFELIQFTEIVVEGGRGDRRRDKVVKDEKAAEAKEGEEKEGEKDEVKEEKTEEKAEALTSEEKSA